MKKFNVEIKASTEVLKAVVTASRKEDVMLIMRNWIKKYAPRICVSSSSVFTHWDDDPEFNAETVMSFDNNKWQIPDSVLVSIDKNLWAA